MTRLYSPRATALRLASLLLLLLTAGAASAQAPTVGADVVVPRRSDGARAVSGTTGLCIGCSVTDRGAVISDTLAAATVIETPVGVLGAAYVSVTFPVAQPAGRYAGFAISDRSGLLDLQLLSAITLTTYRNGQPQQTGTGSALLTLGLLGPDGMRSVDLRATAAFDEVRLSLGAAATVLARVGVHYAYSSATAGPGVVAGGVSVGGGLLGACAGCSVLDLGAAIDLDLSNRATLAVAAGVSGSAYLDVALGAQTGRLAVSVAVESGLSDDDLRAAVQLHTFLSGAPADASASVRIRALAGGLRLVEFETEAAFDEIRIRLSALPSGGATSILVASVTVAPAAITAGEGGPGAADAELLAAAPNPMRDASTIGLRLGASEHVRISLYDALGRLVGVVHDGVLPAGTSTFRVERGDLAAGVYVYRAEGDTVALARRLTVAR